MSRSTIIERIRANKPQWNIDLPIVPGFLQEGMDMAASFESRLKANRADVIRLPTGESLAECINQRYPELQHSISFVSDYKGSRRIEQVAAPEDLAGLELAVVKGEIGVADNGAVWVSNLHTSIRVAPFITQYLVLVVHESDLVQKMHQAYDRIKYKDLGFGVFISGPSKTADIEQALVVGAHGPLGLTVILRS